MTRDTDETGESGETEHTDETKETPRERMEAAIGKIRREGWKAATIHAVVDAVAVTLAVDLALTVVEPPWTPSGVEVASTVPGSLAATLGVTGPVSIPGAVLVGTGIGLVVFVGEFAWYVRQPLVERFEAGNPAVAEALRTARDTVERDADSEMATRLYADVLDRLRGTSSVALVDLRRLTVTVVVVLALSVVSVQAAIYDVTVGADGEEIETNGDEQASTEYSGLQDANSVLGEPETVTTGDQNQTAKVESTRGDDEVGDQEFPDTGATTGPGGGGADGTIQGQQAGFSQQEEIEDAQLVREYNVQIREQEE